MSNFYFISIFFWKAAEIFTIFIDNVLGKLNN